jgi:hypothetical protein
MRSGGAFSDEEIQLLRGLPAVSNVTRDCITYSDTFRHIQTGVHHPISCGGIANQNLS